MSSLPTQMLSPTARSAAQLRPKPVDRSKAKLNGIAADRISELYGVAGKPPRRDLRQELKEEHTRTMFAAYTSAQTDFHRAIAAGERGLYTYFRLTQERKAFPTDVGETSFLVFGLEFPNLLEKLVGLCIQILEIVATPMPKFKTAYDLKTDSMEMAQGLLGPLAARVERALERFARLMEKVERTLHENKIERVASVVKGVLGKGVEGELEALETELEKDFLFVENIWRWDEANERVWKRMQMGLQGEEETAQEAKESEEEDEEEEFGTTKEVTESSRQKIPKQSPSPSQRKHIAIPEQITTYFTSQTSDDRFLPTGHAWDENLAETLKLAFPKLPFASSPSPSTRIRELLYILAFLDPGGTTIPGILIQHYLEPTSLSKHPFHEPSTSNWTTLFVKKGAWKTERFYDVAHALGSTIKSNIAPVEVNAKGILLPKHIAAWLRRSALWNGAAIDATEDAARMMRCFKRALEYTDWFEGASTKWDAEWARVVKMRGGPTAKLLAMPEEIPEPTTMIQRYLQTLAPMFDRDSVFAPVSEKIKLTTLPLIDFILETPTPPIFFLELLLKSVIQSLSHILSENVILHRTQARATLLRLKGYTPASITVEELEAIYFEAVADMFIPLSAPEVEQIPKVYTFTAYTHLLLALADSVLSYHRGADEKPSPIIEKLLGTLREGAAALLGVSHRTTLRIHTMLGRYLIDDGRWMEAWEEYETCLAVGRKVFGESHSYMVAWAAKAEECRAATKDDAVPVAGKRETETELSFRYKAKRDDVTRLIKFIKLEEGEESGSNGSGRGSGEISGEVSVGSRGSRGSHGTGRVLL